eukprot:TRINITY_DN2895_c1_g1_i2.p1 TRINITY_DN2895_c1_g1~~TRINITY_DN2895_c1_g1_i2.p1  ORF type:complete len:333 (+),score=39.09 TRINITY_DN2895_c1_g1_i2:58-1056(+)
MSCTICGAIQAEKLCFDCFSTFINDSRNLDEVKTNEEKIERLKAEITSRLEHKSKINIDNVEVESDPTSFSDQIPIEKVKAAFKREYEENKAIYSRIEQGISSLELAKGANKDLKEVVRDIEIQMQHTFLGRLRQIFMIFCLNKGEDNSITINDALVRPLSDILDGIELMDICAITLLMQLTVALAQELRVLLCHEIEFTKGIPVVKVNDFFFKRILFRSSLIFCYQNYGHPLPIKVSSAPHIIEEAMECLHADVTQVYGEFLCLFGGPHRLEMPDPDNSDYLDWTKLIAECLMCFPILGDYCLTRLHNQINPIALSRPVKSKGMYVLLCIL